MLTENRMFPPAAAQTLGFRNWHIGSVEHYRALHQRSIEDPEGFWAEEAGKLAWFEPWKKVMEWEAPDAKWFVGGKTNACFNCVDRHVQAGFGEQTAIIWVSRWWPERARRSRSRRSGR